MNAWRCRVKDEHGHRCKRHAHHKAGDGIGHAFKGKGHP